MVTSPVAVAPATAAKGGYVVTETLKSWAVPESESEWATV